MVALRPEKARAVIISIFRKYFHSYSEASLISHIGFNMEELLYVYTTYYNNTRLELYDLMLGLHFAFCYPTQHRGASIWQVSRSTYISRCWVPIIKLANHLDEIKMSNRFLNLVQVEGTSAFVTLYTDSSDFKIPKPKSKQFQKEFYTYKNKKFAHRIAICVSVETGDLCWVSGVHRPGLHNDLTVNRIEGVAGMVQWFERIGADGIYKARTEPVYVTPHRKPKGGSLTTVQKDWNTDFGGGRVIVENVFSRVKQYDSMKTWRHSRDMHEIMARCVFQLAQVKNKFRPVRSKALRNRTGTNRSWRQAEAKGNRPIVPPRPPRRQRRRCINRGRGFRRRVRGRHEVQDPAEPVDDENPEDDEDNSSIDGLIQSENSSVERRAPARPIPIDEEIIREDLSSGEIGAQAVMLDHFARTSIRAHRYGDRGGRAARAARRAAAAASY